jgi:hypothetical protein
MKDLKILLYSEFETKCDFMFMLGDVPPSWCGMIPRPQDHQDHFPALCDSLFCATAVNLFHKCTWRDTLSTFPRASVFSGLRVGSSSVSDEMVSVIRPHSFRCRYYEPSSVPPALEQDRLSEAPRLRG